MNKIRYFMATVLLVFSGQSLALFMPYDIKEITETTSSADGGCGHSTIAYHLELTRQ